MEEEDEEEVFLLEHVDAGVVRFSSGGKGLSLCQGCFCY